MRQKRMAVAPMSPGLWPMNRHAMGADVPNKAHHLLGEVTEPHMNVAQVGHRVRRSSRVNNFTGTVYVPSDS